MLTKKTQISTEFIIILSIALIVFLFLFTIANKRSDELYSTSKMLYAKQEADKLATAINTIFLAGNGASKTVNLPETLKDNANYNITVYPTEHIVDITFSSFGNLRHYSAPILTADVTGDLNIMNNDVNLTNSNGIISVIK